MSTAALDSSMFDESLCCIRQVGNSVGAPHWGLSTGLGDDLGFFFVELGVEDLVLDAFLGQQAGHVLGSFDGGSTHQHRTPLGHAFLDVGDDCSVFLVGGQEHQVVEVFTRQRLVRRDNHHRQTVDLVEFERFGIGCTGHAGQLVVQTEVVLEGGRGQGLAFSLDVQGFLGFDRLVQAFRQTATRHGTTGVFVDQYDLAVLHDVFNVAMEQLVSTQAGIHVGQQAQVVRRVQALAFSQLLNLFRDLGKLSQSRLPTLAVVVQGDDGAGLTVIVRAGRS